MPHHQHEKVHSSWWIQEDCGGLLLSNNRVADRPHFNSINGCLGTACMDCQVLTMEDTRASGLWLSLSEPPTQLDLAISLQGKCEPSRRDDEAGVYLQVKVLTSKSSPSIQDFPYYGLFLHRNGEDKPISITLQKVKNVLMQSPLGSSINFFYDGMSWSSRRTLKGAPHTGWETRT